MLQQISGLRTESGITLFGIDYTAHDEPTIESLVEQVDGVLWIAPSPNGTVDIEYRPATGRFTDNSSQTVDAVRALPF
ncbi:hypothetical protein ACFQL4_10980 [Halosimplex aquaticum]